MYSMKEMRFWIGSRISLLQYNQRTYFLNISKYFGTQILYHDLEYLGFSDSCSMYLHAIVLQEIIQLLTIHSIYCTAQ